MKKRIHIGNLKEGMFIHKVEAKWLETPFYHNPVKSADIKRLTDYKISYVWIDTEKGIKPEKKPTVIEKSPVVTRNIETFKEELTFAKDIKSDAVNVATETLSDIRMGKQLKSEKLKNVVSGMLESIERIPDALLSLSRLKDFDNYTFMHSVNVSILSMTLAKALKFSKEEIFEVGMGGILHDIGKMKVPEEVLNHPGRLSGEAWLIMKKHVEFSGEVIKEMTDISEEALALVMQHHERLDGTGYPLGLKFFDIHETARIGAIADVYDAVTSKRVYKEAVFPAESVKILLNGKGKHFQPIYVDTFIREIGLYPVGSYVELTSGEVAQVVFNNSSFPLMPVVNLLTTATHKKLPVARETDLSTRSDGKKIASMVDPESFSFLVENEI